MAQLYKHLFQVKLVGFGRTFPLDMLRYDHCIPATSEDVSKIVDSLDPSISVFDETEKDAVVITLSAYWEKPYKPTPERWRSFGWEVMTTTLETQKM
jgi:hypothetical protein